MLGSGLFTSLFFKSRHYLLYCQARSWKEFVAVDLCAPVILVAFQSPEPMEIQSSITVPMHSENKVIKE